MVILFAFLSLFALDDSLAQHCSCPLPDQVKSKPVNIDTLGYLNREEQYREGFELSLRYLKSDSTNEKVLFWVGEFGFNAAEKATGNSTFRSRNYKDANPHVKHRVIQDTVGYLYYEGVKNYGPRSWSDPDIKRYGRYVLCANRCLATRYPQNKDFFLRYFNTLLAMQEFKELREIASGKAFTFPESKKSKAFGDRLLALNNRFIGYRAYEEGLKFSRAVLDNYSVSDRIQHRWYRIYHLALRKDSNIPDSRKPHMHEKVDDYIPEVE